MPSRTHHRLSGRRREDRSILLATLRLPPPLLPTVDAHRRLRGPYTAAGTILRAIVPDALDRCPDVVTAHDIEILSVAPELRDTVPASRETLTSLAVPEERTRFYSRLRTLRIAHGLTEFLRDYLKAVGAPASLVVDNADHADITDQELLSVLLRRTDPVLLTIVVGTDGEPRDVLADALVRFTGPSDPERTAPAGPDAAPGVRPEAVGDADDRKLAAAYVATECTGDDPAGRAAYHRLDQTDGARLHDRRAEELEARGELSLRLGAIPFHREHGSDPSGVGAETLRFALDYCIDMGFYEATVDYGQRGRAIVDWAGQLQLWWIYTTKMTTSRAALGRPEEAEELYDEARAFTTNAQIHLQAAYATAMLYTRHHNDERKDHRRAKGWINQAIAIASLLLQPGPGSRRTGSARRGTRRLHRGDRAGPELRGVPLRSGRHPAAARP